MTKDQLIQIKHDLQGQYRFKQYCWEQASESFSTINDDESLYLARKSMYYDASNRLDGMVHVYAILMNQTPSEVLEELATNEINITKGAK